VDAMFGLKAAEKSIAFSTMVEDGMPPVRADRGRLVQVLSNLVGNAVKFTLPNGRVEVRVERSNRDALFTVSDDGPGIRPDDLPHIFERFWQPRERRREGAGLGLTIAHGIVEAHGGTIEAESAPGAGSTFRFTIPLA
jgi:signal transduction histidine kinase